MQNALIGAFKAYCLAQYLCYLSEQYHLLNPNLPTQQFKKF